jgi:hypothetical protein
VIVGVIDGLGEGVGEEVWVSVDVEVGVWVGAVVWVGKRNGVLEEAMVCVWDVDAATGGNDVDNEKIGVLVGVWKN